VESSGELISINVPQSLLDIIIFMLSSSGRRSNVELRVGVALWHKNPVQTVRLVWALTR